MENQNRKVLFDELNHKLLDAEKLRRSEWL
jgi:hypothetical protein